MNRSMLFRSIVFLFLIFSLLLHSCRKAKEQHTPEDSLMSYEVFSEIFLRQPTTGQVYANDEVQVKVSLQKVNSNWSEVLPLWDTILPRRKLHEYPVDPLRVSFQTSVTGIDTNIHQLRYQIQSLYFPIFGDPSRSSGMFAVPKGERYFRQETWLD